MINILDILAAFFLIISIFILATKRSFNPKVKIYAFIFGTVGAVLYIIYGILISAVGLIALDSIALVIYIFGIYNANRELKNQKRDPFEVIVPKNFWEDILKNSELDDDY